MRWALFTGVALFALFVIAWAAGRVVHVASLLAPASARNPESVALAVPYADRPATRSSATPAALVRPASEEVSPANGPAALDQDLRPLMTEMKLDPAGPGARVEDLARGVAPALARDALEHSSDNAVRNPEVERELLETWKEQKQILAGQRRGTVDSVLKDTRE
jgi:hypothetical protein